MPRKRAPQPGLFADDRSPNVITGMEPLASDPNQRRIKVNGKIVATLRTGDVADLGLAVHLAWTKSLAQRVERVLAIDKARQQALALLSARALSTKTLTRRLRDRGHSESIVRQIVDEVRRDGWLNERAYAEEIVRSATRRKPAGRVLLEQKLAQRGVEPATAGRVVRAASDAQDDRAAAYSLARRRLATMGSVAPDTAVRRVAGLLARRGFEDDVVEATIERLRTILPSISDAHD